MKPEELRRRESLPTPAEHRAECLRKAAYHVRVRQEFERAYRRLWEALPDDPREP
jgi:hypothetical protein